MNSRSFTHAISAAIAAAALTVLAACGSADTSAASAAPVTSSSSTQVSPASSGPAGGGSDESATTGMQMPSAPSGPHNDADVAFAQMMTVHHQGAIAMADLAPTRAASPKVKELAAKIKAAQTPEITEMDRWLAAWAPETDMNGKPKKSSTDSQAMSGMSGMAATGTAHAMPGMMSDAQMNQMTAATGTAFDRLFLQLMIVHHQGALDMATTEKASGVNPGARALADTITTGQSAEIATMQDLLKTG